MRTDVKRALFLFLASTIFVLALLILDDDSFKSPSETMNDDTESRIFHPRVSFVTAIAGRMQGTVSAFGELRPQWDVMLRSQISAAIKQLSPALEIGSIVKNGSVLITFVDSVYQSEKSSAELAVAEAKLHLLQAQNKTTLAQQDWQRSDIKEAPSDLSLFKPQLHIAELTLNTAKHQLVVSSQNLSYTQVEAPFTGIIAERLVGPGQQVQAGEPLLRILDHRNLRLTISLSEDQWQSISENWQNTEVDVFSTSKKLIGKATIEREGHHIDSETRQYQLFLSMRPEQNYAAVPGQFVQVSIPEKKRDNSINLPESALTREGYIWLIDHDETLQSYMPASVSYTDGRIVVPAPPIQLADINGHWRVAKQALSFFINGKKVNATAADKVK